MAPEATLPNALFGAAFFTLGLLFGSFSNVLIHRIPRSESVIWPGSSCPLCSVEIRWYDNIPLISYLALKGRCRSCDGSISPRYPLTELAAAILFLGAYLRYGISAALFPVCALLLLLLVLSLIDIEHHRLPDKLTLPALLASLAIPISISGFKGIVPALLGGLAASGLLLAIFMAVPGGTGFGDVKLSVVIGVAVGWPWALMAVFLGYCFAGIVAMAAMAKGRKGKGDILPLGPFLAMGAVLVLFYGPEMLALYFGLFGL